MTLKKRKNTGLLKRKNQTALCEELVLKEVLKLS
jgi:hypothetical protein